jgi:hypothetical protein
LPPDPEVSAGGVAGPWAARTPGRAKYGRCPSCPMRAHSLGACVRRHIRPETCPGHFAPKDARHCPGRPRRRPCSSTGNWPRHPSAKPCVYWSDGEQERAGDEGRHPPNPSSFLLLPRWCRQEGTTGLYVAAQNGHLEVVRLLLDSRAEPNSAEEVHGHTALPSHALHFPRQHRPPAHLLSLFSNLPESLKFE